MDFQRFIEQLPSLYENWGKDSVRPKSARFGQVLEQVQGMTTANVMQLLNFAVECMDAGEIYCEIGTYQGSTLIAALLGHPERMAYAVDNFSQFDTGAKNIEKLRENLSKFFLEDRVEFCQQDLEEFLLELRQLETEEKIGVYFYDGPHDYRSQLLGLLLIKPFLAEKALIIVDDTNWASAVQANWDFMAAHPECELLLDLPTPENSHPTFWNGIQVLSWDWERSSNYPASTFRLIRQQPLVRAIYNLPELAVTEGEWYTLYQEALSLHRQQQFTAAESKYREFLKQRSKDAEAWLNLGRLYSQVGRYQESLEALLNSLKIDESKSVSHYTLGVVYEKINQTQQAIDAYKKALASDPKLIDAYNNLGNILSRTGEIERAEAAYRQAIAANPNHFGSYLNLGNLLVERNQIQEAIEAYQTALQLSPENPDILYNLEIAVNIQKNPAPFLLESGNRFYRQGKYAEAAERYQKFLELQTGDAQLYFALSECLQNLNQPESALSALREGVRLHPTAGNLHFSLIKTLHLSGRTQAAIASAETASHILPDYVFKMLKHLIVPVVYDTPEEIQFYRQRFERGLQELIQQTSLETPEERRDALAGIGSVTNFYLAYQGHNDVGLQRQYGNLVRQIMTANYPQWVEPLSMPPLAESGKIRVGYVSAFLHSWSGTFLSLGWLRHCDRQKFEISCYYTDNQPDYITQQFRDCSDVFHHIPHNLEAVCEKILSDKLHILVFPELGMDAATIRLAGLRLAPVQCVGWGHPVTSGLPTIDYFLSSDLMEPEKAKEHYSEALVRLPNIGVAYPKPAVTPLTKTRSDFQLRDDAVVYLSCQAPYKYLPQHDYIFAEIARRVPQAQFMFLRSGVPQQRLQRAFAAAGLKMEDYCVSLPVLPRSDYLMLNLLSDIYLDTISWSGGNTSLDAIACHLPIVTCPGEFMRGRHSHSFLKMLGVTDTIAENEADYIEIAVKLGLNSEWRRDIAERMSQRQSNLFDDKTCVGALEAFYQQAVRERLTQR
ncbi:MAG: tetratricopeptide repeat protein [Oscillatoria princeps RMCB-10]|jgi:predicted O-linked N-acetylglucosamine transferase (SPINDLY family)|nr:tetratricopeptide repeat protein [Oscillatoria princeps RMCB-10]